MVRRFILMFVIGLLAWGCGSREGKTVAQVNDQKITVGQLETFMKGALPPGQPVTPEIQAKALDKLLFVTVLMQEADRVGLLKDAAFQRHLEQEKQKLILQELARRRMSSTVIVTDEEVQKYYEEVYRKKSPKPLPLAQVKEQLRREVTNSKEFSNFAKYMLDLRNQAKVKVDKKVLKTARIPG